MLTVLGPRAKYCDGVSRRSFLSAGYLSLGGIALADVLRSRASASVPAQTTSVIFIELAGGPSQFETYDPKPSAPSEYRGPFSSIATQTPGVRFSQHMSAQAKMSERLTIIRSLHHNRNSHDPSSHLSQTGYYKQGAKGGPNEMPCFGSVIARFRGANNPALPAYVAVPQIMRNGQSAQLGKAYSPFETEADPNRPDYEVKNLALSRGLTAARLDDRRSLLKRLDEGRRLLDVDGSSESLDQFTNQAFDLVTRADARRAFDIAQEADAIRDTYGRTTVGQSLLLARRLVEAGVTCVTVRCTGWDDHTKLAPGIERRGPEYDQAVSALVDDLYERGLQRDVLVVALGEFGRTPRCNTNAGRDHWCPLMSGLLAGGGLPAGVVGASNDKGEEPTEAPYRPESVLAMIYRHLGISLTQTFPDLSGRPRYILEHSRLIRELV